MRSLLRHESGPAKTDPADLDGDDVVGISDFLQLLADWGPCS